MDISNPIARLLQSELKIFCTIDWLVFRNCKNFHRQSYWPNGCGCTLLDMFNCRGFCVGWYYVCVGCQQHISNYEREKKVNEILFELNLMKCQNTVIGSASSVKGISGGERKRLMRELFTNLSIMFCDEPTSCLDAFTAQTVIKVLRDMADSGRTVICTIHQPSSAVFAMFDQLLLMADGRVAYIVELGKSVEYFANIGLISPNTYNPADFYIRELAIISGKEDECRDKIKQKKRYVDDANNNSLEINGVLTKRTIYKANWLTQLNALTWRAWLNVLRESAVTSLRIVNGLFKAILLGFVYWRQNYDQQGVQNTNGAMFYLTISTTYQNSLCVIQTFCSDLPIFMREHYNGMYRVDTYFLSNQLAELPIFIITPLLFVCPYCFMIGFNHDINAFILCLCFTLLLANCACSYGYFISCVTRNAKLAFTIGPALMLPMSIFVPVYFEWFKHISWFYYGNEILMINQWRHVYNIQCSIFNETAHQLNLTKDSSSELCLENGKMVIEYLNFEEKYFIRDILILVAIIIILRLFAFISFLLWSMKR